MFYKQGHWLTEDRVLGDRFTENHSIEGKIECLSFINVVYDYSVRAIDPLICSFRHLVDENVDKPEEHHEDQTKLLFHLQQNH